MIDETKKDKILWAGLKEFSEHGFDKASTDRISKDAGVSKGLIFHYYGSKENLYLFAVNKCIDDIFEEFNNVKFDDLEFIDALIKIMELKYSFFLKNPMHYKILINSFYNTPKKMLKKLEHRNSELRQMGINIIVDMIKDLPLKEDVLVSDIAVLVSSIANAIENKYLSYLASGAENIEKIYKDIKNEYIRLINIVMHGIIV